MSEPTTPTKVIVSCVQSTRNTLQTGDLQLQAQSRGKLTSALYSLRGHCKLFIWAWDHYQDCRHTGLVG